MPASDLEEAQLPLRDDWTKLLLAMFIRTYGGRKIYSFLSLPL